VSGYLVESTWAVAVIVTVAAGTTPGAVYRPAESMLPFDAPPATVHVTSGFVELCTAAVTPLEGEGVALVDFHTPP
jgi:hypothetical protein